MSQNNNDVVYIQLDRPRELRFGHKALKAMEELTGKSVLEIEEIFLNGQLSIAMIEKFVYAGLLKDAEKNNETLTLEKVADLLDEAPAYVDVIEAIGRAFAVTFRKRGEAEGNQGLPAGEPERQ